MGVGVKAAVTLERNRSINISGIFGTNFHVVVSLLSSGWHRLVEIFLFLRSLFNTSQL